jgi:hypothetical protein
MYNSLKGDVIMRMLLSVSQWYFHPAVFWGSGEGGMSYWTFENMEITGGGDPINPPSFGAGIYLEYVKNCTFRNLYVHHNHGVL